MYLSRVGAAGALALFTRFVSLVFVRFWSFKGPLEMRTMMKNTFVGNVAITGGLAYVPELGPGGLALTDLSRSEGRRAPGFFKLRKG